MGRALLRASLARDLGIEVVAVNDLIATSTMASLLARDSVYGRLHRDLKVADDGFLVEGGFVRCFTEKDPAALAWAEADVEVVVEATGRFRTREAAAAHLGGPVRRVVVSAPCQAADATIVLGVNTGDFDPGRHQVISNASCTTNCLAPMIKVLDDSFGVEQGFITTVHAYTGDQMLVDGPHKDLRRARAAGVNIVPTSTGAARATGLVLASMQGRLDGTALRVPVPDGSITDLVALVSRDVTANEVDAAFEAAASGSLDGILEHSHGEPLVSSDIIGSSASCVFDSALTMASGRLVKVYGWYDNEWGYANRLGELAGLVGRS
jgi:glyceraldehyde 3-phosphate dehydrogenase